MRTLFPIALATALAGCQTWGPTWSEATGVRYFRTELNRMPTVIERVDGRSSSPAGIGAPSRIEPGRRVLTLSTTPPTLASAGGWRNREYVLDAEPCMRYFVNAQFDARLSSDWEPVIDFSERIAGCDPASKAQ
jgi:hypothetical protein